MYRDEHVRCEHFLRAARHCKPRLHCFGHTHEGWGAERARWTEGDELDVKWKKHVKKAEWMDVDEKINQERVAFVDISAGGGKGLEFWKENMVNVSIMTLRYNRTRGLGL